MGVKSSVTLTFGYFCAKPCTRSWFAYAHHVENASSPFTEAGSVDRPVGADAGVDEDEHAEAPAATSSPAARRATPRRRGANVMSSSFEMVGRRGRGGVQLV